MLKNLLWILFHPRQCLLWLMSFLTVKKNTPAVTGKKECLGAASSEGSCDTFGLGGADKTKIQKADTRISITPWQEFVSLSLTKQEALGKTQEIQHYQKNEFVWTWYKYNDQIEEDFGIVVDRVGEDYYVVQLLGGGFASVPIENIRKAGLA